MSTPAASSVLIADDTSDLRSLVRDLIEATGRFEVVAEASDGAEAVELAARHRPDVVLLDLAMPVMDGLQALPAILTSSPMSRVVALSGFEARRMAAAALAQGAVAYLDKDGLPDGLIRELLPLLDDLLPSESRRGVTGAVGPPQNGRASDGPLNARYLFETFVPGSSNRFAHAAALSVAETPGKSYNPLFIYGATGLGKTHLLHAIGHYVTQNYDHHQVRYITTETFLSEYVDTIRNNSSVIFKHHYREVDILLINNIQFIKDKKNL